MTRMWRSNVVILVLVFLQFIKYSEAALVSKKSYSGHCNAASTNCDTPCNIQSDCPGGDCWRSRQTCTYAGYCNAASTKCGTPCNIQTHCPGGDCWRNRQTCTYAGYCNAASTKCDTPCNIQSDCPKGDCWRNRQTCTTISYAGYCNAASTNCGTPCNIQSDCPKGDCWRNRQTCTTISYAGYCNAASTKCGTPCNIQSDCPGGDCWRNRQTCTYAGYCNAASTKCSIPCNIQSDCPGGDCTNTQERCGGDSGRIIGTYLGALPDSVSAPALSSIPTEINFILLGFAKDANYDGNFLPFSEWTRMGITKASITADKANNPNRKYIISLGGAAAYGGTFNIQAGLSVKQWVINAKNSISKIVMDLNADGVDIQFEGGTKDPNFASAVEKLARQFKKLDYITSVGPFYDKTWSDYVNVNLNLKNVDYVFCQFYAKNRQTVKDVANDIKQAKRELGHWSKLIAGFNSYNRNPSPKVSLDTVKNLRKNLMGTFTWAAEHSKKNTPPYCIEKNSAKILNEKRSPGTCNW